MKYAFALLMTLALFPTTTPAQESTPMTMDQKNVLSTISTMTEAFNVKNMDGILSTYEDRATIMFQPGEATFGRDKFAEQFQGFFAAEPNFQFENHQVIVNDDIAVHTTPWTMTGKTPDGQEIAQSGLSIAVLRRQDDGSWLMIIDNPYGDLVIPAK